MNKKNRKINSYSISINKEKTGYLTSRCGSGEFKYKHTKRTFLLRADQLRVIADKLDELNGVKQ